MVGGVLLFVPLAALALIIAIFIPVLAAVREPASEFPGMGDGAGYAFEHFASMYQDAADAFDVNPFLLMAVHEDETDYGRSTLPGVKDGTNGVCCAGPMQFFISGGASPAQGGSGATWAGYRDAIHDPKVKLERPASYPNQFAPHPNVYDSYDAIYAAAKYFKSLGAGPKLDERTLKALISYKGSPPFSVPFAIADYTRAKQLEAASGGSMVVSSPRPRGGNAVLQPDGDVAELKCAPLPVQKMIAAANAINDKRYGRAGNPLDHRSHTAYDCSSSTSHVLWAGDRFGLAPVCSTAFETYGLPGKGKWVTIYAHGPCGPTGHVFMEIAGLRFDTNYGYDTGPARHEHGPRWRTGPIPDLSGFVVRHPVGL